MIDDAPHRSTDGPGRTPGNVNSHQRVQLTSPCWLFGQVTSQTRHQPAYDPTSKSALPQTGAKRARPAAKIDGASEARGAANA